MQRETMEYDVVIVGAGPSGLSAAIRLKQLCKQRDTDLSICIVEKGAEVGAHIISGAVIDPRALTELLPNWQTMDSPLKTAVTHDEFLFLTERKAYKLPTPGPMKNHGNYIISLGQLCRWLAEQAQDLGVEIYPGFAARDVFFSEQGDVQGVITGDVGVNKQGEPTERFQPGMILKAKQTLFAEGCRGSLTKVLFEKFKLGENACAQTYGIGVKELWEVESRLHVPGKVVHSIGWPLDHKTYGGSFLYHWEKNKIALGFVVGLDYQNPTLNPFEELQRFKHHPSMKPLFENGQRLSFGARALSEGGFQSIPQCSFPGGMLIGDCAGFLNVSKIKGTHTAIKSAMVAADVLFEGLHTETEIDFETALKQSWLWDELYRCRNIRPGFKWGLWPGLAHAALDTYICRGRAPWTLKHRLDHRQLKSWEHCKSIEYPKPDGMISFDKLSSVYLSNTNHEEDQPCHLQLHDKEIAIKINYEIYGSPEQYYCPANVYEIIKNEVGEPRLQINAQNCVHCKTCDIKDPTQNINWVTPEGGGGPHYSEM